MKPKAITKFRLFSYLYPPLMLGAIFAFGLFVNLSYNIITESKDLKSFLVLLFPILFLFAIWYLFYAIRFKCDIIEIDTNTLTIKKTFGLGEKISFELKEIELYPSYEHVKIGTGGKVLIYKGVQRLSEVSDLSYSNYAEFIFLLQKKKQFREYLDDSYINRLKAVFI